jgi:hypothetical protein
VLRTVTGLTSESFVYTTAMHSADFATAQGELTFRAYQVSAQVGDAAAELPRRLKHKHRRLRALKNAARGMDCALAHQDRATRRVPADLMRTLRDDRRAAPPVRFSRDVPP